mgnify:FL=1
MKRRDVDQWMSHRMLPENLRQRIRRYEQYKWQETRGVEEDSLIQNLPKDLRRDINRHHCWALLTRVSSVFTLAVPFLFYIFLCMSIFHCYEFYALSFY